MLRPCELFDGLDVTRKLGIDLRSEVWKLRFVPFSLRMGRMREIKMSSCWDRDTLCDYEIMRWQ